jgi:hypothetical protein
MESRRARVLLTSFFAVFAVVAGARLVADQCDAVRNGIPVNRSGNSWCEGWSPYWCTYCWNESGANCATSLYVCTPRPFKQPPR